MLAEHDCQIKVLKAISSMIISYCVQRETNNRFFFFLFLEVGSVAFPGGWVIYQDNYHFHPGGIGMRKDY